MISSRLSSGPFLPSRPSHGKRWRGCALERASAGHRCAAEQSGVEREEREKREYSPEDLLEYKPGDVVPKSGVYRFVRGADHVHAEPEEINAVRGELFPTCRHCRDGRGKIVDNAFYVAGIEQFQV